MPEPWELTHDEGWAVWIGSDDGRMEAIAQAQVRKLILWIEAGNLANEYDWMGSSTFQVRYRQVRKWVLEQKEKS